MASDSGTALLIDMKTAAARLGVSARTLWSMTTSGEIPTVRIRRRVLIDARDLEAFIENAKTGRSKGGNA